MSRRFEAARQARKMMSNGAIAGLCWALGSSQALAESPLSGTYVLVQQTASRSKVPVVADVIAITRSVSLQKLEHTQGRLRGSGPLCDLTSASSSKLFRMSFPSAFVRSLPPVVTDASVTRVEGETRFRQGPRTLVIGARLENPARDALPTSAKDARVLDQDADGHPGMTIRVHGLVSGTVYVVQRSTTLLEGRLVDQDISGDVDCENEQSILGASTPILHRNPRPIQEAEQSFFHLVRVPDSFDCEKARQLAAQYVTP